MKSLFSVLVAAVLLAGSSAHAQLVTGCGQTVTSGILAADLDCSAETGCAVIVADKGSLDLAGHTITAASSCGVGCDASCSIAGASGTIEASVSADGVISEAENGRVTVSDLNVVGGNIGVVGARVVVENTSVTGTSIAVRGYRSLDVSGSEIADNITGLDARRHLTVQDTTILGNLHGADALRKMEAVGVTVSDNGISGIRARKVHATTSTFSDNGGDPACSPEIYGCVDILSERRLKLSEVTCGTSGKMNKDFVPAGTTWGFCSLD